MANEIIGNVHRIGQTESIPTKNGSNFQRRSFVLVQHRFNQDTGEPLPDNFVQFDVTQQKCTELDKFNIGDRVRVSFAVEGRAYEKDGKEMFFNTLRAFRVEPYVMQSQVQSQMQAPPQQPMQQVAPPQYAPQPQQPQQAAPAPAQGQQPEQLPF